VLESGKSVKEMLEGINQNAPLDQLLPLIRGYFDAGLAKDPELVGSLIGAIERAMAGGGGATRIPGFRSVIEAIDAGEGAIALSATGRVVDIAEIRLESTGKFEVVDVKGRAILDADIVSISTKDGRLLWKPGTTEAEAKLQGQKDAELITPDKVGPEGLPTAEAEAYFKWLRENMKVKSVFEGPYTPEVGATKIAAPDAFTTVQQMFEYYSLIRDVDRRTFDAVVLDLLDALDEAGIPGTSGVDPGQLLERLRLAAQIITSTTDEGIALAGAEFSPGAVKGAELVLASLERQFPIKALESPGVVFEMPKATRLTIFKGKALAEMSVDELDDAVDVAMRMADAGNMTERQFVDLVNDVGGAKRSLKVQADKLVREGVEGAEEAARRLARMPKSTFEDLNRRPIGDLTVPEMQSLLHEYILRLPGVPKQGFKQAVRKLDDVMAALKRDKKYRPDAGFTLPELPMIISGSVIGFFLGMATGDTPGDRLRNGVMTAAGFGLSLAMFRRMRGAKSPFRPQTEWEKRVRQQVISVEDDPGEASKGLLSRIERFYFENIRRSYPLDKIYNLVGAQDLPLRMSAAKMLEMFGLWKRQSDAFVFDSPRMFDDAGNIVPLDAPSLMAVAQAVDGETQAFGEFLIAARSVEMYGKGKTPPLDIVTARQIFVNAPQRFHDAQVMSLQYARALADIGVQAGLISQATRDLYELDAFYVPLVRLFGGEPGMPSAGVRSRGKQPTKVTAAQPFQKLTRSTRPVRNGFEALLENTPRVLRAAEFNRMAVQMANLVEGLRRDGRTELANFIMRPISAPELKTSPQAAKDVDAVKDAIGDLGRDISDVEARSIIDAFGTEQVNVTDGILTMFRNGTVERWRVHEDVALAMRSVNNDEFSMLMRILGAPAQLARVGITASPRFVFWQAFRDNFQLWMNSPEWFGYIPFIDQARGWWATVSASAEYRKAVAAGLTGESLTAEGLKAIRTRFGRERSLLADVRVGKGQTTLKKVVSDIKTMNMRELYADLIVPIADAARVGAYLRGRGRGETVMNAVYRAKRVGVNYGQRGSGRLINNLNHMTLFLNPSLQSVDEAARAFMRDPVKYTVKAFVGITLPSIYLWFEYKDDKEIQELRRTETGRRFWWLRDFSGRIRKIPKPILDGQLWGSSVEAVLDEQLTQDPTAVETWARALAEDGAIHLLPTFLAVPGSIAANWNLTFGGKIVGQAAERVDPELQFTRATTDAARIAGKALAPVSRFMQTQGMETLARAMSPAGIDYLVRNFGGEVSFEMMKGIGQAARYLSDPGFDVTAEEAPFISSLFPRFPTGGAQSIREFYKFARLAEQRSNTLLAKLNGKNPAEAGTYFDANQGIISLLDVYQETRADLTDLRASLVDIEEHPEMTSREKRTLSDEILRTMIETARIVNLTARDVMAATDNAATP